MLAAALLAVVVVAVADAQVTRLTSASLVRECLREDPAADATVDVNCTSSRVMLKMLYRATPTTGAGQIARIVLNSPEFEAVFDNRTSGSDPTVPQVEGFEETSVVVEMSELRIRYATQFWMMAPEEVAVWSADSQVGFTARLCESAGEARLDDADCLDDANKAVDSAGRNAASYIIDTRTLEPPGCFELRCGDCLYNTFRGGNDRNALNRERFWWAGNFFRVYRVKPEPLLEYTVVVSVTAPGGGPEERIELGLQQGLGMDPTGTTFPVTDNVTTDAVSGAAWTDPGDDIGPGRLFQTVAWSQNRLVRARLVSQAIFGVVPPTPGLILARDPDVGGERGYHESRENPRALTPANCAIFTRTALDNDTGTEDTGVALCPVPNNWMYGTNFQDELRVGSDCCSCLGITPETWFGDAAHRGRSCWNTHFTCIPGHDYWSADRSRTPRYFIERMQDFRRRQYCILCNGDYTCGLSEDAFQMIDLRDAAGIYATDGSNATAPGGVTCDWGSVPESGPLDEVNSAGRIGNRQARVAAVALQAPPNLPPQWDNTGRSNMWMYRGQLFLDPPDNVGLSVVLVVDAEAAFSRMIQRVPQVRLEGVEFGEDCSVVVGEDGALFFRLVNESPFAGDFTVTLECDDPAYVVRGTNSIGVGLNPAPAFEERNFLIAVNRPANQPSPQGGTCTLRLFDAQFQEIPEQTLTIGCREEQKQFTGAAGAPAGVNTCIGGDVCEWSNFVKLLLMWVAIVLAVIALILIGKKFIVRSK